LIVIASIHQPSTTTFALFDKLLLLSGGRIAYNGAVEGVQPHFASIGYEMPLYINPAEFIMGIVNDDFNHGTEKAAGQVEKVQGSWSNAVVVEEIESEKGENASTSLDDGHQMASPLMIPFTLVHRSFIKSYRDIVAYQIRIAMYIGLAIMMGTVWLRLTPEQKNIQSWSNSIVCPSPPPCPARTR
jgi:ABC-type multidrug transport system ATPase subunit